MDTLQTNSVVPQMTSTSDDPPDQVITTNNQGSKIQIQDIHPNAKEEALEEQIKDSVYY